MRDLQEAIEVSCRAIEQYMKDRGEQYSFHLRDISATRDAHHPVTDFKGGEYPGTGVGTTRIDVALDGVHLGTIGKTKQNQRAELKARLKKPGDPKAPDVVADIPDAGYRAGVRALLEKFQKGIRNATELANSGKVPPHLKNLVVAAEAAHQKDEVVLLLRAILDLQDDRRKAQEETVRVRKSVEDNPELQLQQRLKLKMKANYTDQRDVLVEFVKALLPRAHAAFNSIPRGPVTNELAEKVVDEFLEGVGD